MAPGFYLVLTTLSYDRCSLLSFAPLTLPAYSKAWCKAYAVSGGIHYSPLWLLTLRQVRASLFASAVATSIRGLRASILARDDPDGGPFRMAQQMTAIAPVISNRLISRCPIFEVLPRICHPPVDFCLGTSRQ